MLPQDPVRQRCAASPSPLPSPLSSPRHSQLSHVRDAPSPAPACRKFDLDGRLTGPAGRENTMPADSAPSPVSSLHRPRRGQMSPLAPLDVGQRLPSPAQCRKLAGGVPGSPQSPRLHSSSSSQIFERDVQEDINHVPVSPAIPSHLATENHIPPVLDASSVTLTDDNLDPDSVAIVTHTLHHAAAPNLAHPADDPLSPHAWHDDAASLLPLDADDSASLLDNSDVRRLSFVSFADVLNGEHAELDALSTADSLSNLGFKHDPACVRRTRSSHFNFSSPASNASSSPKAASPTRSLRNWSRFSPACSQGSHLHNHSGEFNIETMSQALRRSESQDFRREAKLS